MPFLVLDDRDAAIVYSTGWGQAGSSNEFNSTTTFSDTVGATADVTFFGTGITVFGTIASSLLQRPSSSYSIDGGTAVVFNGPTSLSVQYNVAFFRSPTLPLANHTLKITNTGNAASLFLDYLLVTPPAAPLTTTVTTTLTPPAVTNARTVTVTSTAPAGASGQANSADSQTSGVSSSSNAGAIAGGIVGALAFLALLVLGVIFFRRRQRRMRADANDFWNTANGSKALPSPPLAPQFQSYPGQPPMVQANNTGYSSSATYEPYAQYSSQPGASGVYPSPQPPPAAATSQYPAPSTQMNGQARPVSSDLAYYSTNDAYGGYSDPGPYPPSSQMTGASAGQQVGPNGRVRVNLD